MRSFRTCLSALLIFLMLISGNALAAPTPTPTPTLPPFDETVAEYDENNPGALTPDQLYAQAAILINQDDGTVLMEKSADTRMNPASTTKIMTLLLALEYGDINSVVTIPPEAGEIPLDSSKVPVTPGEEMTFMDLLYGLMLRSGNDAANAIAVIIAGSVDSFVDMMNDRAAELGCTNTHFVNPHGYTAEGHYTSVRDMARITQAAMQIPTFAKIVGSGEYTMNRSSVRDEMRIENSNELVIYGAENRYRYATGVKTGTTSAAGQCLVSSATKDGINLIGVAYKSTVSFPAAKWQDAVRLMEYGFSQYHTYNFQELYEQLNLVIPISGFEPDDPSGGMVKLNALMNRTGSYEKTIFKADLPQLMEDFRSRTQIEYTRELNAPVEVGTIIGNLTFTPEEGNPITAVLVADRSVAAASTSNGSGEPLFTWLLRVTPSWLLIIIGAFLVFLLLMIVARIVVAAQRRRRRRLARARARARREAQLRRQREQRYRQRTSLRQ